MMWKEFKDAVEAYGVVETTKIRWIDVVTSDLEIRKIVVSLMSDYLGETDHGVDIETDCT